LSSCVPAHFDVHSKQNVLCFATEGTFGQPEQWDIYSPQTFQHPMVPYDILVDPLSLPSHPVIAEREQVADVLYDQRRNVTDNDIMCNEVTVFLYTV
jgi:hypothetical protein